MSQKIQTIVELAEELYEKMTEVRQEVLELRDTMSDTHDRVQSLEEELGTQRRIIEAIAEDHNINLDQFSPSDDGIDPDNQ